MTTPPSIKHRSAISTGGKTPGIDAAATTASTADPIRQQQLATGDEIEGNQVQRDGGAGEVLELDVPANEPTQTAIGNKVIPRPTKTADQRAHADREDVLALEVAPHPAELPGRRHGLWSRCDEGGVERPHRGCHQQVRDDAALVERVQHSHLQGAEARTAREDECGCRLASRPAERREPVAIRSALRSRRRSGDAREVRQLAGQT